MSLYTLGFKMLKIIRIEMSMVSILFKFNLKFLEIVKFITTSYIIKALTRKY